MKSFIIAEIASNWEGNFTKARKLIKESKNSGADAVKFQIWRANDLYTNKHPNWNFIKKSEITFEKAQKLLMNLILNFFVVLFILKRYTFWKN